MASSESLPCPTSTSTPSAPHHSPQKYKQWICCAVGNDLPKLLAHLQPEAVFLLSWYTWMGLSTIECLREGEWAVVGGDVKEQI